MDNDLFDANPRAHALNLVEEGHISAKGLLYCALVYMSHDDVKDLLDANELSPRFDEDYDDEEDEA